MNRSEPILDGQRYHVYNRGNRRQRIFRDDSDYRSFLRKLSMSSWKYKVGVVSYALMPNHFHLVLGQPSGGSIERLMNSVACSIAKHVNAKYGEVGHLFQGRYRYSRINSDESLIRVVKYLHLNPVAAKLVRHPLEWPYSDFAEYANMADGAVGNLQSQMHRGEGPLLPCSLREYLSMIQEDLDKGVLQPGDVFDEGRL
jgi:putative transposase